MPPEPGSRRRSVCALAALPGLLQGVRQQGQRAGVVLDLAYQQVDQTGLDQQSRLAGRSFDRGAQVFWCSDQVQAAFDEPG